jgi:hypothetical protein
VRRGCRCRKVWLTRSDYYYYHYDFWKGNETVDSGGYVYLSDYAGYSWAAVASLPVTHWGDIAMSCSGNTMIAVAWDIDDDSPHHDGAYISMDAGATWNKLPGKLGSLRASSVAPSTLQ